MAVQLNFLSLDVGKARIGVAIANSISRLPSPLTTLRNDGDFLSTLKTIIYENQINELVIGLPKNLDDDETEQTAWLRVFYEDLKSKIDLTMHLENESLSSVRAENDLKAVGRTYAKEDIDALAACYILDDFIKNTQGAINV